MKKKKVAEHSDCVSCVRTRTANDAPGGLNAEVHRWLGSVDSGLMNAEVKKHLKWLGGIVLILELRGQNEV